MSRTRRRDLGVDWHLPNPKGGYFKRRFATTTVASANLLGMLADDGLTWAGILDEILFDDEARAVAAAFVEAGHGDTPAATMLAAT